jgi:hypothetical protein
LELFKRIADKMVIFIEKVQLVQQEMSVNGKRKREAQRKP